MIPAKILGTGSFVPERVVRNHDLANDEKNANWITQRTGICQRHIADCSQASSDLAYEAAIRCLEQAKFPVDEIDLILVATTTPDHVTPSTACLVQARLGGSMPALDINAACSGFVSALVMAAQMIQAKGFRHILVIGSETVSRIVDPKDIRTAALFGDGAGAVLLGPTREDDEGILAFEMGADGSKNALLKVHGGGFREPLDCDGIQNKRQYLSMQGPRVFKWAVAKMVETTETVLKNAGFTLQQIDHVIFHQANQRMIDAAVEKLNIEDQKSISHLDRFGNTSAASIPLSLDCAVREGRVKRSDRVLLCSFGSGLTWAAAILVF